MGPLAIVGLVAGLVGTGASITEGTKARREQRRRNEKIAAQNAAKEAAARRRALREERVRRARLVAEAELTGAAGGSTALAGVGLSGTLAAEKASAIGGGAAAAESFSASESAIAKAQTRQQLFSNVAQIGTSVFQSASGFEAIDNMDLFK